MALIRMTSRIVTYACDQCGQHDTLVSDDGGQTYHPLGKRPRLSVRVADDRGKHDACWKCHAENLKAMGATQAMWDYGLAAGFDIARYIEVARQRQADAQV